MTPIATRFSIAAFGGCAALATIALWFHSDTALALSGGVLVGLGVAWSLTLPTVMQLRGHRLELLCRLGHGNSGIMAGALVPGMPFRITCTLRHRAPNALELTHLVAILPSGVSLLEGPPPTIWVAPGQRTEVTLTLVASAAGRVVMQGVAANVVGPLGLFEAPLYFPHPLVVKIVPRAAPVRGVGQESMQGLPVERSGRTVLRRHGGGTELRELRELQPGDPFKSIAWKPSARAGRLLVREVEREVQRTVSIVLDVSGSMRGGEAGHRKLDFALELATVEARRCLDRGDRVGLLTVDGRVLSHVQPGDGVRHMLAVYDALLGATEVVDLDLTDTDDDAVLELVGRYLRQQDGMDFSHVDGWHRAALLAHVSRALINEPEPRPAIVAGDRGAAQLRQFCRQRGIPLRYRADTRADGKGLGLARALRTAGGDTRMPRLITVVTDFDGVLNLEVLRKALMLMKRLRHDVLFVMPQAADVAPSERDGDAELLRVYRMHERRREREARAFLGKLGVPLLIAGAHIAPATAVARAQRVRRVA